MSIDAIHILNKSRRNRDLKKLDNYCDVCGKGFINEEKYIDHVHFNHVICDAYNCNYSASEKMMRFHRIKHIKSSRGKTIDSIKDTEKWLNSRKIKFPRLGTNKLQNQSKTQEKDSDRIYNGSDFKAEAQKEISALEYLIRKNMRKRDLYIETNGSLSTGSKNDFEYYKKIEKRFRSKYSRKEKICSENCIESLFFKLLEPEVKSYENKLLSIISRIINNFI